jgi:hypothetical protein
VDGAGGGSFNSRLANLLPNTSYFVRAYATNAAGTAYGISYNFTTKGLATLATDSVYDIMALSARAAGRVLSDGGVPVSERGFCWSYSPNPSVDDNKVLAGNGLGAFVQQIQSLAADTLVYVRAFAGSSIGFSYGNQISFRTQSSLPVVNTIEFDTTNVGAFGAYAEGVLLKVNGANVSKIGFCWSLDSFPTIQDSTIYIDYGFDFENHPYNLNLVNLTPNETHFVRAYAISETGRVGYGNIVSIKTKNGIPIVVLDSVFQINANNALARGRVLPSGGAPIITRGFCWSINPNPTINDSKTNNGSGFSSYSASINNLLSDTIYYVRAYATTMAGTGYSNPILFKTLKANINLVTDSVFGILSTSIKVTGNILISNVPVLSKGFCLSKSPNPTLIDTVSINGQGLGVFNHTFANLLPDQTYFIRSYATYLSGTVYGNEIIFKTATGIPFLVTDSVYNIGQFTANVGGNALSGNGDTIIARGFCWSLTPTPTVNDFTTINGIGLGVFSGSLSNLLRDTIYFIRAFATTNIGSGYGNEIIFRTQSGIPSLSTDSIFNIGESTANIKGNALSGNGATILSRGFCWSLTPNPTISNSKTVNGSSSGIFSGSLSNLLSDTIYYVRAYATTNVGTGYGNQISFRSLKPVYCTSSGKTTVLDVTNSITGKTWMDRNLGASRVATSSSDTLAYGDLYQWGRRSDGHQCRNSATTTTLSSTDQPPHGNFIINNSGNYDWRSSQNDSLWQGINGVNNPCPSGYRLPTSSELEAERISWNSNGAAGAFASPLKLTVAGERWGVDGSLIDVGKWGFYRSSSSHRLQFNSNIAQVFPVIRASGNSVRCIKN